MLRSSNLFIENCLQWLLAPSEPPVLVTPMESEELRSSFFYKQGTPTALNIELQLSQQHSLFYYRPWKFTF